MSTPRHFDGVLETPVRKNPAMNRGSAEGAGFQGPQVCSKWDLPLWWMEAVLEVVLEAGAGGWGWTPPPLCHMLAQIPPLQINCGRYPAPKYNVQNN